jgi:hypothetical protein
MQQPASEAPIAETRRTNDGRRMCERTRFARKARADPTRVELPCERASLPGMRLSLTAFLVLSACAHASAPPPESGGGPASDVAALPGNAAVQARLGPLPAPPRPWSTVAASLSPDDFVELCPYLVANVHMEGGTVTCPDGSTGTITEHVCEPAAMSTAARGLPCAISWGEIVACRLAMVEHPCDGGPLGENLEECQAFDACTCTGPGSAE